MTDDLSIQQQKPSVAPYVLGGALAGGVAGAGTAYVTAPKPKYSSYEDIINDTKDNFEKNAKEAIEDADAQTKAINAKQSAIEAGEKWENDKKAFIEAHKEGAPVPDENYKELEAKLKAKQDALEAKRTELVNAEIEKIKKTNPTAATEGSKKTATLAQSMDHKAGQLYRAGNDQARLAALEKELQDSAREIAERFEYTGTPEEIKAAKEKVAKEIVDTTHQLVANKDRMYATAGKPKLVKSYLDVQKAKQDAVAKMDSAFVTLNEQTGRDFKALYMADQNLAGKGLRNDAKLELSRLKVLNQLQTKYAEAAKSANGTTIKGWNLLKAIVTNGNIPLGNANDEKTVLEKFTEGLNKKEKAAFEKMFKGDIDAKTIEAAIQKSENKLNSMSQAWTSIVDAGASIKKSDGDIKNVLKDITKKYGEGTYVKNGTLYNKEGKVIKTSKKVKLEAPKFNVPEHASMPKDFKIEYSVGKSVPLSESEVAQRAKEAITDEMLRTETEARNVAQKALEDAKAKLPKGAGMSEEEALKKFIEVNGEKTDAMKKAFGDDVKALLEKKIPNKKLAIWAAAGAAALAALGYAIAPKKN